MPNDRQVAYKIRKILNHSLDRGSIYHHFIGDIGQLCYDGRDRPLWIDEGLPGFADLFPIKTNRSDLNDRVFSGIQTGGFNIQSDNGVHSQDYTRGVFLKKKDAEVTGFS